MIESVAIERALLGQIKSWLYEGKVLIIYGARQVGKTTLSKRILEDYPGSTYLNCEHNIVKELLESGNLERFRTNIGNSSLVVLDEAQKIKDIGSILKLIHDTFPDIQILATGSSSFELSSELSEPLTGRNVKFTLFPFSLSELKPYATPFQLDEKLEEFMRYGMYPEIIQRPENQKTVLLDQMAGDYLFKDVLKFENLKRPELLLNLLKALALQLGNEVSFRELSGLLKVTTETIQRYIELLEKSFVLFRLPSYSRNLRNEIARSHKFYFYDLGIRNSLLHNYLPLSSRTDTGSLWENFCLIERMKKNQKDMRQVSMYFWRTYQQKEIDLIEESEGKLKAFEFKWNPKAHVKMPAEFLKAYNNSSFEIVHRENYQSFML
jgi:hypothetical protein